MKRFTMQCSVARGKAGNVVLVSFFVFGGLMVPLWNRGRIHSSRSSGGLEAWGDRWCTRRHPRQPQPFD